MALSVREADEVMVSVHFYSSPLSSPSLQATVHSALEVYLVGVQTEARDEAAIETRNLQVERGDGDRRGGVVSLRSACSRVSSHRFATSVSQRAQRQLFDYLHSHFHCYNPY